MDGSKCPACRRRFPLDSESVVCTRCGADLSLLIRMRRHTRQRVVRALSGRAANEEESRVQLQKAQRICYSPEVQQLLTVWDSFRSNEKETAE